MTETLQIDRMSNSAEKRNNLERDIEGVPPEDMPF